MEKKLNIVIALLAVLIVLMIVSLIPNLSGLQSDAAMRRGLTPPLVQTSGQNGIPPTFGQLIVFPPDYTHQPRYIRARVDTKFYVTNFDAICHWEFDWGDGSTPGTGSTGPDNNCRSGGQVPMTYDYLPLNYYHTYSAAGTYTVRVKAWKNSDTPVSTTANVTVQ